MTAHGPKAIDAAKRLHPDFEYAETVEDACIDADVVLHLTEWKQFRELDPAKLAALVTNPTIIDGRNVLDPSLWRKAGWTYRALGRPTI